MSDKKRISIVIPVFNEQENVIPAYRAVVDVFEPISDHYDLEFIFSDNHSTDSTFERLQDMAAQDCRVKVIRFNRNYGFQRSLLTAYHYATGDAAVQLDCDLQDPPALIPEFLTHWNSGHDVVVGVRKRRPESIYLTLARKTFYLILNRISDDDVLRDAGDFRLVDRSILLQLRRINDCSPYVRGMISSLAKSEMPVLYDRSPRERGASKFPVKKLFSFALDGIIGHSIMPLRLAAYFGIAVSLVTLMLSSFYIFGALVFGRNWPSGFATTTVLILFGISLNAIFMGILGEYVSRIYQQVRQRPLTVIERSINIDSSLPTS